MLAISKIHQLNQLFVHIAIVLIMAYVYDSYDFIICLVESLHDIGQHLLTCRPICTVCKIHSIMEFLFQNYSCSVFYLSGNMW